MKLLTFLICFLGISTMVFGQNHELTVGESVSDIEITNIINYKKTHTNIADFRGNLLIIDFFASYCTSCIKALPRFDSLQKQYGDKLQILLVTFEKEEKVKLFFQKIKALKTLQLPIVTDDSVLSKVFPHRFVSHEVWINKGVVSAITGAEYVTAENIEAMLSGTAASWPVKNDDVEYDYRQPILSYNPVNAQYFSYPQQKQYAVITGHVPNVSRFARDIVDSVDGAIRTFMMNYPILNMFLRAWGKKPNYPFSHVIIEAKDKEKLIPGSGDWELNNTYSYEAVFLDGMNEEKRLKKIRTDLEFYFNLEGRFEKRKLKCMVFSRTAQSDDVLMKFTAQVESRSYKASKEDAKKPVSVTYLLNQLNRKHYGLPFIDETGYTKEMYMLLDTDTLSDIAVLKTQLKEYGLSLNKEVREVEMFVIKDAGGENE